MNGESQNAAAVRRQLVDLVHRHGPELLDDSRRVRAMLADAVAGATAEANLVGLALSSGIPAKLRDAARDPSRAGTAVADTAAELERTSSVQAADSRWAVGAIAEALGISSVAATAEMGSGTAPAPARPAAAPAAPQPPGPGLAGPNDLTVRVAGQEHIVAAGSVFTFGRDPSSTVVLESTAVSRQHGRVQRGPSGWEYVDLDSTQGSFVDGARVRTHPLRGETVVVLGQGPESVQVRLSPFGQANTVLPPGSAAGGAASGRAAATELPQRPGGVLGSVPAARTELGGSGGPVLTVMLGPVTRTVPADGSLTIGRESDNGLVAGATTVSRHHLIIEGAAGGWRLRDLGSTSGTWLDGRRVSEVTLSGRQEFVLGDLDKGDRLVTEAPGGTASGRGSSVAARAKGSRGRWGTPVLAAVAIVAVLALVAAGTFLVRALNDDNGTPAAAKLTPDQLAQGTVQLSSSVGSGSGTVIDKKLGLILTNAHVVAPAAVGMAISGGYEFFTPALKNPTSIDILVADGIGKPAEPRFTGEVVAVDGYLDLAVVKITKTTRGGFVEADDLADLVQVPIGDSDTVKATDELSVIGYPGSQDSLGPTYSRNVVSGYSPDERVGTNRGWINSTDVVAHGNSGGLAANADGELVGIPSLLRFDTLVDGYNPDYTTVGSAMRPVNLAKDLIAAARAGKPYKSDYVVAAPANAKILGLHGNVLVEPADPGSITGGCNEDSATSKYYAFGVDYENFSGGDHTDVVALFKDPDTGEVLDATATTWKTALPKKGCLAITTHLTELPDSVELVIAIGGDMKPIWDVTLG
jgi:pSer/pThr/pTyr-binding forkhead associated (FHA) protein/S1-C subfamily serine protease